MAERIALFIGVVVGLLFAGSVVAQAPDHPLLTEAYVDPPGINDAPVGHDPANDHQEYLELYLPSPPLAAGLNKDALNLTIYDVEGDVSSSGYGLVNYRIDLPTFDLDPSNGNTALPRPPNGVVVIGWVDYAYSDAGVCTGNGLPCSVSAQNCADATRCEGTPTGLAHTPGTREGLVNGGITASGDYMFVALNGAQFTGTTNFSVPVAISYINMPGEANSGIFQNGSGAFLLVNRDAVGYVELYDDKDPAHQPPIPNADPALAAGNVLLTSCFLDGFAVNDDPLFDVTQQPYAAGTGIDLDLVLPLGGAYSLLIPQVPEVEVAGRSAGTASGYARLYPDVRKTTENGSPLDDDPVMDALGAYRHIRAAGPFFPTPGQVVFSTSPPELSVGDPTVQTCEVLSATTCQLGILAANVGGDFPIDMTASPGTSSDSSVATFASGSPAGAVPGQEYGLPEVAVTGVASALDGATATAPVTVTASNTNGGDPGVVGSVKATTVTATVLNPSTGKDAAGQSFQATVFVAVVPIPDDIAVANEFLPTDLGQFLASQPDVSALQTIGNAPELLDPASNISSALLVRPMIKELPGDGEECTTWKNPPGPLGRLSFASTVTTSAEVVSGATTYDASIGVCLSTGETVIKAIRLNIPDTTVFDGVFSPAETVHFVDPTGDVGNPDSGLTGVTTSRTFEVAIIDTAVRFDGSLETGRTDDFGLIVEVLDTEPAAQVVQGEYVFLSFTGGLQAADIDTLDVPPGNNVATAILLDLDKLHDVLGIRTIESVYVVDAGASGEVDVIEAFSLNPSGSFLSSAVPATGESLWRSNKNTVRITFSTDITVPSPGQVLIQQLLPNGMFGADLSSGFSFAVENNLNGDPRVLKIVDIDPADLVHREWYTIRSVGAWTGGGDFTVDYVVQTGDSNNDGVVLNLDVGLIDAAIPDLNASDQDRRDIDGDGTILNADVSAANIRIPSLRVAKPTGH